MICLAPLVRSTGEDARIFHKQNKGHNNPLKEFRNKMSLGTKHAWCLYSCPSSNFSLSFLAMIPSALTALYYDACIIETTWFTATYGSVNQSADISRPQLLAAFVRQLTASNCSSNQSRSKKRNLPEMAGTALSMARSMLGAAISVAASAAAAEMSLLMGVRKDIWFMKDELETMQAFLLVAVQIKENDVLLKVWAKQVRDMSYNIEDCLSEFMVHVASPSLSWKLMKLKDRHRIAMQIHDLKSRVEEVSSRNTRYNLIEKNQIIRTIGERDSCMEDIRNQSASNIDEAELVGFSNPKQELMEIIDANANNGPAQIVCVVGMGGLGKTTLTKKVYESIKNFSCSAWITVSQSFVRMEFLKVIIKELFGEEALKIQLQGNAVREENLSKYLREQLLEKRYFIVLDDLWNKDDWNWIKSFAFPIENNKVSRIMVTTRDVSLAEECISESSRPFIYHHKPLETKDAINLLLRKSRKGTEDMKNDEDMRKVILKIVKKSGCLLLAILTIGGMLATKAVSEWQGIYNQIPSELEENRSLEAMRRMVTLGYNHLPSHLKSCFLYLSIFPEDFEIRRRRLVERWIAEGFVIARDGVNLEDVGNGYFNELINRSMIQPSRVNLEGIVKSCRVHDIVRDVMIAVSRDEIFSCSTWDNVTGIGGDNFRHVAYRVVGAQIKACTGIMSDH